MNNTDIKPIYLIITAHHDYRTPRRTSIHFIADELAKRGHVKFFSMRYSLLSKFKNDTRTVIDGKSNIVEVINGVECYLWKTPIHPFSITRKLFRPIENILFWSYKNMPSKVMLQWMKEANVIIYESGTASIFFELGKHLNPNAKHIYRGSDDLATINAANYVRRKFARFSSRMDSLCLLSKRMPDNITSKNNSYYVPSGLDADLNEIGDPSPLPSGTHAVSIGSMLFDPTFFEIASHAFPDVTFHIIGSGSPRASGYGPNVIVYGVMKYEDTIKYIKHASIGVAPYISDNVPVYLADSSLKMLQYDFFGLPTVCPHSVTGSYASRYGYTPGDAESIKTAVRGALSAPHVRTRQILSWSGSVDRLLNPIAYTDTRI
jgi:2-beta-glucuronyltransferase